VREVLRLLCPIALLFTAYTILSTIEGNIGFRQASVVLSVDNIPMSGIQVWAYTHIMRVSAGRQAGTGFAILSSLFIICPLASAPAFGAVGDHFGFTSLYTLLGIFMLGGFGIIEFILHHSPSIYQQKGRNNLRCKIDMILVKFQESFSIKT
jgi:predicted MFS family arabinose efflux permease